MNTSHALGLGAFAAPSLAFKAVLINPYELGRQSFNLAAPAALLRAAGFDAVCLDLSLQQLDPDTLRGAGLVAIHLGMHTAQALHEDHVAQRRRCKRDDDGQQGHHDHQLNERERGDP